jgi:hypothetical protein
MGILALPEDTLEMFIGLKEAIPAMMYIFIYRI